MRMNGAWLGTARILGQTGGAPQEVGDAGFGQVLSAPKAVALFYSPNCPYSRAFLPIYQALGPQTPGVFFALVNVDQSLQNAGKYQVHMLPTVVFFVNGKEAGRIDGVQSQSDFTATMAQSFGGGAPAAPAPGSSIQTASTAGCPVVTTSSPVTPILWGVGAAAVTAGLGAAAYFLFRKK